MEPLNKDNLPQNWRAPLIKVVSNHVWQVCDRVDMTDPANHPNGDGSGKSPAYGAYAGPVEHLLNTAFEGALKNWEIGPFAAWIGRTRVFNELDLQWDFAISLPNQQLTKPVGSTGAAAAGDTSSNGSTITSYGSGGSGGAGADARGGGSAQSCVEEDIPVDQQWSLVVWLKPGERGTTADLARFVAVVDKLASPAFTKASSGAWDIFLSHYQASPMAGP
ncbi:hypothetical protein TSOC_013316 [Tetrabaena socialis]|uniref:Uncharacterized protein n=1 Tax=Tetrabaena socialis TaxID=47790 RepID=A0A2J7ZKN8_9CHLO|nr:hypothetical protein TSOC_013316 [Tetrabaena socialis]|eukprot:PNH00839.1 hypothetical protein TSOC_013316 [Tetrabaena socialis]